jgi:N-acyl-L-homoserine lactone synthetase
MVALDTKGKICATTRLILNSPIGFPTPNNMICNIKEDPKLNFAELSRVFVSKEVRGLKSSKTILYNLSCLSFYFIKKHNIDYIYAGLEKEFLKLLKLIKINFRVIGKPVEYYGNRYPCISSSRDFIGFDMDLITKY